AERGFQQDDAGYAQRGGDDDRRQRVGQDVAEDDSGIEGTERPGRLDELLFSKHQKLGPHQTPDFEPPGGRDHDDDRAQPHTAGRRGDRDDDQQEGHRDDDVGEAHQRVVQPAAVVAGERAQPAADHQVADDGEDADHERDPGAAKKSGQLVATEVVGAQDVLQILERRLVRVTV